MLGRPRSRLTAAYCWPRPSQAVGELENSDVDADEKFKGS